MNKFIVAAVAAVLTLSACDGDGTNPFDEAADDGGTGTGDSGTDTGSDGSDTDGSTDADGISGDRDLPPGTASPQPDDGIVRTEPTAADGGNDGDGYVTDVRYDAASDTFYVDNLAFDAANEYQRGTNVSSLGPYAVYESLAVADDSLTGNGINQFTYRAIYGVSASGNTQFAVVRTGSYVEYGFGGFIYQRNNGVTLPTTGQALYTGTTAGLRDFDQAGGLQYTTGEMQLAIDFEDFNPTTGARGDGVRGVVFDRRVYDINGVDITQSVIDGINTEGNAGLTEIPVVRWVVSDAAMDDNGEIVGEVFSTFTDLEGNEVSFEDGNYYAVVSGDNAEEVVGVVVLESTIGSGTGVTARETSGFIVER